MSDHTTRALEKFVKAYKGEEDLICWADKEPLYASDIEAVLRELERLRGIEKAAGEHVEAFGRSAKDRVVTLTDLRLLLEKK